MQPGSIVELIDDSFTESWVLKVAKSGGRIPVKGVPYTVRQIRKSRHSDKTGILLEEIVNPKVPLYDDTPIEPGFVIERFRELMPPIQDVQQWVEQNTKQLQTEKLK